jgi:hypothetical protein
VWRAWGIELNYDGVLRCQFLHRGWNTKINAIRDNGHSCLIKVLPLLRLVSLAIRIPPTTMLLNSFRLCHASWGPKWPRMILVHMLMPISVSALLLPWARYRRLSSLFNEGHWRPQYSLCASICLNSKRAFDGASLPTNIDRRGRGHSFLASICLKQLWPAPNHHMSTQVSAHGSQYNMLHSTRSRAYDRSCIGRMIESGGSMFSFNAPALYQWPHLPFQPLWI